MRIALFVLSLIFSFTIVHAQQCQKPFGIHYNNTSTDSITIKWISTNSSNILGYQVAYGVRGTSLNACTVSDTFAQKEITLNDLEASTQYIVYVRTICDVDKDSGWNGPFAFTTHFTNPSSCLIDVHLQDDNCSIGGESYFIDVKQTGVLGQNIFVESIDLILEHPWLADLELTLFNPAGSSVTLAQYTGAAQNNFGISNATCDSVTTFTSNACLSIEDGMAPFVGSFNPISSLINLNDGSSAQGTWKLEICDRSGGDKGIVKHFSINLIEELCEPIVDFYVSEINGTSVKLNWSAPFNCQSMTVEYGVTGFVQGGPDGITRHINCKNEQVIIDDLMPLTKYDFYLHGDCITTEAEPSCVSGFMTGCNSKTYTSSFDQADICENSCTKSCNIQDDVWINNSLDSIDWIVWQGRTDTDNTGPTSDINGDGKYIYLESNPTLCSNNQVGILESTCIRIQDDPGCGMSFSYHLIGKDTSTLSVEILEPGQDWQEVFTVHRSLGWERQILSLDQYIGKTIYIRFIGTTGQGDEGDIALDQIDFHGNTEFGPLILYFDNDRDGYGIMDSFITTCDQIPDNFSILTGDCNDSLASINPGMSEILCNGIDENCSGLDDDNSSPPSISILSKSNESCKGLKDGSISLNIVGNNGPYSVHWNNDSVGITLSDISSGFYWATITDASSCATRTEIIEVDAESKMTVELIRLQNTTCTGRRDGEIEIKVTGGVPPYEYEWNIDQIQATIIGLVEGKYQATITDQEGCQISSQEYTILADKPLIVGAKVHQDVSCFGYSDGILHLETSNGVPPYDYKWDNGNTSPIRDGLPKGTYSVTIEDHIGCEIEFEETINEPDSLYLELFSLENIKCFGDQTGSIKTNTHGGSGSYTYQWSNSSNSDDIFNLSAGQYSLEVFDQNGCTGELGPITLTEPDQLILDVDSIKETSCRLKNDGYIALNLSGGSHPYAYFWRGTESDTLVAANIKSNNYGFTAIDNNDCKISLPGIDVPFGNLSSFTTLEVIDTVLCPDVNEGSIRVEIHDAKSPLIYNWSNGSIHQKTQLTDTLSSLGEGVYQVTVTDSDGCISTSSSIQFKEFPSFSYFIDSIFYNTCNNDTLGYISIVVDGGTKPYNYHWSNGVMSNTIVNLEEGEYDLTVTDKNDCLYHVPTILLSDQSNLQLNIDIIRPQLNQSNGSIEIFPDYGVPQYTIEWDDDPMIQSFYRNNLIAGPYRATIYDQLDCSIDTTIVLDPILNTNELEKSEVLFTPNPANRILNVVGAENHLSSELMISDLLGKVLYTSSIKHNEVSIPDLPKGTYIVTFRSTKAIITRKIVINQI